MADKKKTGEEEKREEEFVSTEELKRAYRASIAKKIAAGETGLSRELEYLDQLDRENEKKQSEEKAAEEEKAEELGVPERLRIKRKYTKGPNYMSDAAREARRKGGKAKKKSRLPPAWKHGKYSKTFVNKFIRPCKSTCIHYPCEIVDEGSTKPGEACLDKVAVILSYQSIIKAIQHKEYDEFNELTALKIAQSIEVLDMSLEDIIRDGTIIKSEKIDKEGKVIGYDIRPHPSLIMLPKLIAELGMTPQEAMITKRQIAKQGTEEEGAETLLSILGRVSKKIGIEEQKTDEDGDDE